MRTIGLLSLILTVSNASAQFIALDQTRTVSAWTQASNVVMSATDASLFSGSVASGPWGMQGSKATASQTSQISDSSMTASGSAGMLAMPAGSASGHSSFSVTFTIASTCSYSLSGGISWYENEVANNTAPSVILSSSTGVLFSAALGPPFGSMNDYAQAGRLEPGDYTLAANAQATFYHGASESFNVTLSVEPVPEPESRTLVALAAFFCVGCIVARIWNNLCLTN